MKPAEPQKCLGQSSENLGRTQEEFTLVSLANTSVAFHGSVRVHSQCGHIL